MALSILDDFRMRATELGRRVVFTGSEAPIILEAVDAIWRSKVAVPILLTKAQSLGHSSLARSGVTVLDQDTSQIDRYVHLCLSRWRAQGITETEARSRLSDPDEFAVAMVRAGDADAVISGPISSGKSGVPPVVTAAGRAPDCSLLSNNFYLFFSDGRNTLTVTDPVTESQISSTQLADLVVLSCQNSRLLFGNDPRVAMLTLEAPASLQPRSRFRSARDIRRQKAWEATERICVLDKTIAVDREFQTVLDLGHDGPNVLIFVEPQTRNLQYRLEQEFDVARVVGPIIQGVEFPVNEIPEAMSVDDIINIVAMSSIMSADRKFC